MVEKSERARVGDQPRDATEAEWEVFVRDETEDGLRYVGTVTAPNVEIAYEQATKLFGWYADDVWLCRSSDVHRFSTHDLDADAQPAPIETDDESRTVE